MKRGGGKKLPAGGPPPHVMTDLLAPQEKRRKFRQSPSSPNSRRQSDRNKDKPSPQYHVNRMKFPIRYEYLSPERESSHALTLYIPRSHSNNANSVASANYKESQTTNMSTPTPRRHREPSLHYSNSSSYTPSAQDNHYYVTTPTGIRQPVPKEHLDSSASSTLSASPSTRGVTFERSTASLTVATSHDSTSLSTPAATPNADNSNCISKPLVRNPIVFQCRKCHVILADSFDLLFTDRDLQCIALSG